MKTASMHSKPMRFIYYSLKMCVAELCQKMNCHICWSIYWTLHVMKKYWNCIKGCVEDICMYILAVLSFILKYIEKYGKKIVTQQKSFKGKVDKMF